MGFFRALQVLLRRNTDHLTHLVPGRVDLVLLDLQLHQFAGQHHFTQVVPGVRFNHHFHAFLQRQMRAVMEIAFACIFELHLDEVCQLRILRQIAQPVAHGQHVRRIALGCTRSQLLRTIACCIFFHIFNC